MLMNTYGNERLTIVKGHGAVVVDAQGKEYIDAMSGLGVNVLGHVHPRVNEAIVEQLSKLIHISDLYHNEPKLELAPGR